MEENKLFDEMVKTRIEQHNRTKKLMVYVVALFCVMVLFSTILTSIAIVSNNETVKHVETKHAEIIAEIQREHNESIRELWRTYFETDYDYGDINQNVKIGGKEQ